MVRNILKSLLLMWLNDERPCFSPEFRCSVNSIPTEDDPSKRIINENVLKQNKLVIATIHALKETKELFAKNKVAKGQKLWST